jgi:hypothetical protein
MAFIKLSDVPTDPEHDHRVTGLASRSTSPASRLMLLIKRGLLESTVVDPRSVYLSSYLRDFLVERANIVGPRAKDFVWNFCFPVSTAPIV